MNRTKVPGAHLKTLILVSFIGWFMMTPLIYSQERFRFAIHNALEKSAEKQIIEKVNFGVFQESFGTKPIYWGVLRNDEPAQLTFRFQFDKPIQSGLLHANLITTNFENSKKLGSGKSLGSLWCSTDGKRWVKLMDAPTPKSRTVESHFFHNRLPVEIKGSNEIWLQTRMQATGMKGTDYSVGQFCRSPTYDDQNEFPFDLRIRFQSPHKSEKELNPQLIPEIINK